MMKCLRLNLERKKNNNLSATRKCNNDASPKQESVVLTKKVRLASPGYGDTMINLALIHSQIRPVWEELELRREVQWLRPKCYVLCVTKGPPRNAPALCRPVEMFIFVKTRLKTICRTGHQGNLGSGFHCSYGHCYCCCYGWTYPNRSRMGGAAYHQLDDHQTSLSQP